MTQEKPAQSNAIGRRVLPFALFSAFFAAYVWHASREQFVAEWSQLFTEAPLLLYLFALLQRPLRARWFRPIVAALPMLWVYVLHDQYFVRWGDVPSFSDVALFADLFTVLGSGAALGLLTLLLLPIVLWLAALDRNFRLPSRTSWVLLVPLLSVAFASLLSQGGRTYAWMNALTEDAEWSDRQNAEQWGRLYAAILRQARRASFAEELRDFEPLARSPLHLDRTELAQFDRRNVHILVLESFVDLRLLSEVRFSKAPFDDEFARWVDPFISTSVSPVFGGETARAEFEVLCGVPSLRLFGLEFLGFSGKRTYCVPTILREAGYRTVLTFPHGPVFFNTRRAYPGLGFEQLIYADRFSRAGVESIALGDVDYLEDGDLFPQNLQKVRALVREGSPFLNYVMTMYGHWPFEIDTKRHPLTVQVTPAQSDLTLMANQMLLRTQALRAHVQALIEADPHGIIVLVADHLPPLPAGKDDYLRLGYHARDQDAGLPRESIAYANFLLVFVDGVPRKLPRMRHFDLPSWLFNELSHGAYCRERGCAFGAVPFDRATYLSRYQTILGLAASP